MRGCLIKAPTKRGLKKGESAWRIIIPLGRGPDGKHQQKWITFRGTRQQAEQRQRELVAEVDRGEFVMPTKTSVAEWLDEWLDKVIKPPRCTENTYVSYSGIIKNHLKPAFGHLPLQGLMPMHLERYYADLKLSASSASLHHCVIFSAMKAAQRNGLVRSNPAARVINRPQRQAHVDTLHNVWNADEARTFLAHVKTNASAQTIALFSLALDSGMRKSELLGLQWRDLDGVTLRVERQLLKGGESPTFGLPKSQRARSLDLSEETVALLTAHKREQAEFKLRNRPQYEDHNLVFSQDWGDLSSASASLGAPLTVMRLNHQLDRLCTAANVKRLTVHGLRHTCATLLLAAGVPPHVVQRRLGHKRIEITLEIYSHVLPSQQADAASRLAALLHR